MLHRFQAKDAPRVFLLPAIPLALAVVSVVPFLLDQTMVGIVVIAVSAWISYHVMRYAIRQFRSNVQTTDAGLVCLTSFGTESRMDWSAVSHAGAFMTDRAGKYLFVYAEEDDELLSIPPYYSDREELEAAMRRHSPVFLTLSGATPDHLAEELKPYLSSG